MYTCISAVAIFCGTLNINFWSGNVAEANVWGVVIILAPKNPTIEVETLLTSKYNFRKSLVTVTVR